MNNNLLAIYRKSQACGGFYSCLIEREAKEVYGRDFDKLSINQRDGVVNKVYGQAYAYRSNDDPLMEDNRSKNKYGQLWLSRCIDEAIEECVLKVPNEKLKPDNPVEIVRRYLELKLFGEWKNVELNGKPSLYYINEVGDYYSRVSSKILKCALNTYGYKQPGLYQDAKMYQNLCHRDVARYFIPNDDPVNKTQVNHINGVKTCNAVFNLEWCTSSENSIHAVRNGLAPTVVGEERWNSKHTEKQIREVCENLRDHPEISMDKIAKKIGIPTCIVEQVYFRKTWTSISKDYVFPPRSSARSGEEAGNAKNKESQIRKVCELLKTRPDLSFREVTEMTGVGRGTIKSIYALRQWKSVSKDYLPFPPRVL